MRLEWVFLGVVLLSLGGTLKVVLDRSGLQRLALGFSILWALMVALHLWSSAYHLVSGLLQGAQLAGLPVELLSYWLVAVSAFVPGILLLRYLVRDHTVVFPAIFEGIAHWFVPLAVGIAVPAVVIMSGALLTVSLAGLLPAGGAIRTACQRIQALPIHTYVVVASTGGGVGREKIIRDRIPPRAREILLSDD